MLPRPPTYTQLQPEARVTLASLKQQGLGIRAIARVLGRNASTDLPPFATQPGYWSYQVNRVTFGLAENVLLAPNEAVTFCILDVWEGTARKVFSVA